jgi:hypothetical protein
MWERLETRTILIALVIVNAVAIGLAEIQRRTLVQDALSAQATFEERANRNSEQQALALDRIAKQLPVLTDRVNHTEILTLSVPESHKKVEDILERVRDIQRTLEDWKQSRSSQ